MLQSQLSEALSYGVACQVHCSDTDQRLSICLHSANERKHIQYATSSGTQSLLLTCRKHAQNRLRFKSFIQFHMLNSLSLAVNTSFSSDSVNFLQAEEGAAAAPKKTKKTPSKTKKTASASKPKKSSAAKSKTPKKTGVKKPATKKAGVKKTSAKKSPAKKSASAKKPATKKPGRACHTSSILFWLNLQLKRKSKLHMNMEQNSSLLALCSCLLLFQNDTAVAACLVQSRRKLLVSLGA